VLSREDIDQFVHLGYVKISNAFSDLLADDCAEIIWKELGLNSDKKGTWKEPVIRLGNLSNDPFVQAANTSILLTAYQQLASDNWQPRLSLGTFPVRFPARKKATDTGWHVDGSFGSSVDEYINWRINVQSRGRALLMLFLFSDVTASDAPTRLMCGSHLRVAKILQKHGQLGLSFKEIALHLEDIEDLEEHQATGDKGTVFLCHPFLVHAAQQHVGEVPRLMAQPPLIARQPFDIESCQSPVAKAIKIGIHAL